MNLRRFLHYTAAPTLGLALALSTIPACGSDEPSTARGNGTNDVMLACKVRATWTKKDASKCKDCRAAAPSPSCDCSIYGPFAAQCVAQADVVGKEADCNQEVRVCVSKCLEDCTCIDSCYNGHAACRKAQSALDGCVAEACDGECK